MWYSHPISATTKIAKVAYTLHHTYREEQSGKWVWVYRPEGARYAMHDRCIVKNHDAVRLGSRRWFTDRR